MAPHDAVFGASASLLGRPDIGLLTATEMTDNARRVAATIDLLLIADAGYGKLVNIARTVREHEQAGVATRAAAVPTLARCPSRPTP